MTDNIDTTSSDVTEIDLPEIDDEDDYSFADPDEDTSDEPDQPETEDEPEDAPDTDESEEQPEAETKAAAVELTLPDGSKIPAEEAVKGYLRQADYSRKTSELAQKRQETEAYTQRIASAADAFVDYLAKMVPDAPDPALAHQNPAAYVQAKAMHEAAMAKVQELMQGAGQVKAVQQQMTAEQRQAQIAQGEARLVEMFPDAATKEGAAKFKANVAKAASELGFTERELAGVTDHRLFAVLHLAGIGLQAKQARAKATEKVASVPPMAPRKAQLAGNSGRQQAAVRTFNANPTLRNAAKLDWAD